LNRAPLWELWRFVATADFFCSALLLSRPAFFCRSFFWALLQANSCVRQLRGFCFPGSALHTIGFPPIKQPLALEAEATRFCVPQENEARKRRKFSYVLPIC